MRLSGLSTIAIGVAGVSASGAAPDLEPTGAAPAIEPSADFTLHDRTGHRRARAQSRHQHHRLQRHVARSDSADARGRAADRGRRQRHRRAGAGALARPVVPSEVDGADEEGTPPVPPHGRRRYHFTPTPAGTRWYHTHTMAMTDLHRGSYTGQFGFLVVESGTIPGATIRKSFSRCATGSLSSPTRWPTPTSRTRRWPQPEKPAVLDTRPNGLEVAAAFYSINDKALGAGEPIRVRAGPARAVALAQRQRDREPQHRAARSPVSRAGARRQPGADAAAGRSAVLGPGERVDAYVEMNQPGVWIMGAPDDDVRNAGLGVVIEYAEPAAAAPVGPAGAARRGTTPSLAKLAAGSAAPRRRRPRPSR